MDTSILTPLLVGATLLTISDGGSSTLVISLSEEQLSAAGGSLAVHEAASGRDDLCDRFDTFRLSIPDAGQPDPLVDLLAGSGGPPVGIGAGVGALEGTVVALSAGHGVYYSEHRGVWTTQRGEHFGIIEDRWTVRFISLWLAPMLEAAGATILDSRGPVAGDREVEIGVTDETVSFTEGTWTHSDPEGSSMICTPGITGCMASFEVSVSSSDLAPVFVHHPDPGIEQSPVIWTIHSVDATHSIRLPANAMHGMWIDLGRFWLEQSEVVTLTVQAPPGAPGVVSLAGIRIGGGRGDIEREGSCSGEARYEEAALYWLQGMAAPDGVTQSTDTDLYADRRSRGRYAAWAGADVFVSIHTNGGGGTGTVTFTHESRPPPGSDIIAEAVQQSVVEAIRAGWDPSWSDRGVKHANLDELADARPMPSVLLEVGFHDNEHDAWLLRQPDLRRDVSRAIVRSLSGFVSPASAPVPPTPTITTVIDQGDGRALVTWEPGQDPMVAPGSWDHTLHIATSSRGIGQPRQLGECCSAIVDGLATDEVLTMRMTALSEGGASLPSAAASVILGDATRRVLLVDGFHRRDELVDETTNTLDSAYDHTLAIHTASAGTVGVDFATPSASTRLLPSIDHVLVDWIEGLDPAAGEVLDDDQARALMAHVQVGGAVLLSGENIAGTMWSGSVAARELLVEALGIQSADAEACASPILLAVDGSVLHDDATADGPYVSKAPYPLVADTTTVTFATCASGEPVATISPPSEGRPGTGIIVNMPLEAMGTPAHRARLMELVLAMLATPGAVEPDDGPSFFDPPPLLHPSRSSHGCSIGLVR